MSRYRGAVDRRATEDRLEVALLRRRQVVLEDHGVGVDGQADLAQLWTLPEPRNVAGSGDVATLDDASDDVGPGGINQQRSSSSWRSSSSALTPGKSTPTSTMRSRNVRSMSVVGT